MSSKASTSHTLTRLRRLFHKGCADYHLLEDGDRVLVALSGGKDSMVLARLLGEQARLHKPRIEVAAAHVVMDNIPYATDLDYLQHYCQEYGMPLEVIHTTFDATTDRRHTPCFLCSWYRRKALFQYAEAKGYNKVALGHHQDDILVTLLMNLTFEGSLDTMRPLMQMKHYPLAVIRPLCLAPEELTRSLAEEMQLPPQRSLCPYETATRRDDMQRIFRQLQEMNPEARYSMWRAVAFGRNKN